MGINWECQKRLDIHSVWRLERIYSYVHILSELQTD